MPGDKLNFEYGSLNKIKKPIVSRSLDKDASVLSSVSEIVRNWYTPKTLLNSGPMQGIVLRVERNPSEPEPDSWWSRVWGREKPLSLPPRAKVRIPEIHAHLPDPEQYTQFEGKHQKIIDYYPTFEYVGTTEVELQPGSIVLVDFSDKQNFSNPIILNVIGYAGPIGGESSKNESEGPENSLCAKQAPGDRLGSGQKNLSNQIPSTTSCTPSNKSLNFDPEALDEFDHNELDFNDSRRLEKAYRNGQEIGIVELVELPPSIARGPGRFIVKHHFDRLKALIDKAREDKITIRVNSAFRTNDQQINLYERYGPSRAAKPKHSNHQNGVAYDFSNMGNGDTKEYRWMEQNAGNFGFVNVGKNFKKKKEYWHWELTNG